MLRIGGVLAIPRAFGDFPIKKAYPGALIAEPDIYRLNIDQCGVARENLLLVLATDGVWDVLTNEQVGQCIMRTRALVTMASSIVNQAIARQSEDNVTALVTIL